MTALLLPVGTFASAVLLTETLLWLCFASKIKGMLLPRSRDASFFGFFTLLRLRLIAVSHMLALAGLGGYLLSILW